MIVEQGKHTEYKKGVNLGAFKYLLNNIKKNRKLNHKKEIAFCGDIYTNCCSKGGIGLESRPGRVFVINVVHIQCFKLYKSLECAVLSMLLCTIKNPSSYSKRVEHSPDFGLSFVPILRAESDVKQYFLIHSKQAKCSSLLHICCFYNIIACRLVQDERSFEYFRFIILS